MASPPRDQHISEHFVWGEVLCHCGCEFPEGLIANAIRTAEMAEAIRDELGEPMRVHSWYRCPAYNARIGGAPDSEHPRAKAVDFSCKRLVPSDVQTKCRDLQEQGIVGGLGSYPGFTHCDWGPRRNWTG